MAPTEGRVGRSDCLNGGGVAAAVPPFLSDCESVHLCVCVANWLIRQLGALNANSSKTVKAMDFKFNTRISRQKGGLARAV